MDVRLGLMNLGVLCPSDRGHKGGVGVQRPDDPFRRIPVPTRQVKSARENSVEVRRWGERQGP